MKCRRCGKREVGDIYGEPSFCDVCMEDEDIPTTNYDEDVGTLDGLSVGKWENREMVEDFGEMRQADTFMIEILTIK